MVLGDVEVEAVPSPEHSASSSDQPLSFSSPPQSPLAAPGTTSTAWPAGMPETVTAQFMLGVQQQFPGPDAAAPAMAAAASAQLAALQQQQAIAAALMAGWLTALPSGAAVAAEGPPSAGFSSLPGVPAPKAMATSAAQGPPLPLSHAHSSHQHLIVANAGDFGFEPATLAAEAMGEEAVDQALWHASEPDSSLDEPVEEQQQQDHQQQQRASTPGGFGTTANQRLDAGE